MREAVLLFAIYCIVDCCTNSEDCEHYGDLGEPVSDTTKFCTKSEDCKDNSPHAHLATKNLATNQTSSNQKFCDLEFLICVDCLGLFTVQILTKIKLTRLTLILESWKKSKTRDHHRACFAEKNSRAQD